jgi:hypothetical protein
MRRTKEEIRPTTATGVAATATAVTTTAAAVTTTTVAVTTTAVAARAAAVTTWAAAATATLVYSRLPPEHPIGDNIKKIFPKYGTQSNLVLVNFWSSDVQAFYCHWCDEYCISSEDYATQASSKKTHCTLQFFFQSCLLKICRL